MVTNHIAMIGSEIILGLGMAVLAGPQPSQDGPIGHWINPAQSVVVEITNCGANSLCGHVRWASPEAANDAKAKGTDPLEGTALFRDFAPSGDGKWKGRLFVPDMGKTSRAELRVVDDRHLKITGCAVGRLLCKSQVWDRIDPVQLPVAD